MAPNDTNEESDQTDNQQLAAGTFSCHWELHISSYVKKNPRSTNTQLFSMLALLNAYVPESFLLKEECQKILGPPDPIHGGPPFEERMEPFTKLINTSNSSPQGVRLISHDIAKMSVERLAGLNISRSKTAEKCMASLCGAQTQPDIIEFIKDLLTKREMGKKGKDKFSRFIEDVKEKESYRQALLVLKTAAKKFSRKFIFPQTIARLYYLGVRPPHYQEAEKWAKIAIQKAKNNSYVADTLGQVYKHRLIKCRNRQEILQMAHTAFGAFKDVEEKAEKEGGPEDTDIADIVNLSNSFNNRGLFGFIQVAKIISDKHCATSKPPDLHLKVEEKFDFFEWYLSYSRPDMETLEPDYFWRDVARCYNSYTKKTAADSTSFPGLLDCLNHGLFTSKGKRAGFLETEKTGSDLQTIRDVLRIEHEAKADDANVAERYILSNIILSNKIPSSPEHNLANELKTILHRFLVTEVGRRSPELYLLVLLLFWPEEQLQMVQEQDPEELEQRTAVDNRDQETGDDIVEEQNNGGEPSQPSPDLMFDLDLQQYVTYMENAFEKKYAKYLKGRYLLPLFFLGKGSGLSRWIHKSRLDAIVEEMVDADLGNNQDRKKKKMRKIDNMWISGKIWQVPRIRDILLPVRTEPQLYLEKKEVFVCAGGKRIKIKTEDTGYGSAFSSKLFYLGFNIQGPVLFKVERSDSQ